MPLTQVQKASVASTASGTTLSVTLPAAPSTGNLLIALANADTTISTPSGWTLAVSAVDTTGLYLWYRAVQAGDSATVTVTLSASKSGGLLVMEYSGQAASPLDKTAHNTPGGTGQASVSTGTTAATVQGDELVVAAVGQFNIANAAQSVTWSAGYTAQAALQSSGSTVDDALWVATQSVVATGAQSATCAFSGTTSHPGGLIATFKASVESEASRGSMVPGSHAVGSMAGTVGVGASMSGQVGSGATMSGGG